MSRCLAVVAALVLSTSAFADNASLVGRWSGSYDSAKVRMEFKKNGSYTFDMEDGDKKANLSGKWSADGGTLTLSNDAGEKTTYEMEVTEDNLILQGGDLSSPLELQREVDPGTKPPPDKPSEIGPLIGRWEHKSRFLHGVIVLIPDGRYASFLTTPGVDMPYENGKYESDGKHLTLRCDGNEVTYDLAVNGESFTISGGNLSNPLTYDRVPGSQQGVVDELPAIDAAKAKEDDEWRAKFPVGTLKDAFQIPAVGEVPADAKWKSVKAGATVFSGTQLYVWYGRISYVRRTGGTRVKASSKWFFQPNGRVYLAFTQYAGSEKPRDVDQPFGGLYYLDGEDTKVAWGIYTIDKDDKLQVTLDNGDVMEAYFLDGRRNLVWEKAKSRYGNVVWEEAAMKERLNK